MKKTVLTQLIDLGVNPLSISTWRSDLYVVKTGRVEGWVDSYEFKKNVTQFVDNEGVPSYEIPLAYLEKEEIYNLKELQAEATITEVVTNDTFGSLHNEAFYHSMFVKNGNLRDTVTRFKNIDTGKIKTLKHVLELHKI